ncbi:unnamed protein product, partial [Meganyctiphanes norvegica]
TIMDYPSTTQALFALIVMIIVLLFILIYCCWGSFSCTQRNETAQEEEHGSPQNRQNNQQRGSDTAGRMVIVPFSNMIYVGDPETRQIYQIPIDQDKPPAYTDVFMAGLPQVPPPPYSNSSQRVPTNTDPPPAYEDVLTSSSAQQEQQQQEQWTTVMLDPSILDNLDTSALPRLTPNMLPANRIISQLVYQRCSPPEYSSVDDLLAQLDPVSNPSTSVPTEHDNNSTEDSESDTNQSDLRAFGDSLLSNGNNLNALLYDDDTVTDTNTRNTTSENNR